MTSATQGTAGDTRRPAVVFVHGLFSSAAAWSSFDRLIGGDPDLADVSVMHFEYSSPRLNWNLLRRIPDYNVLADNLQTYLEVEAAEQSNVVLVAHSQGGLVVQRFLSRMIADGRGRDLARISRIVMFACPNSGTQLLSIARRGAVPWRHPQERELRPISNSVMETQRVVLSQVVHARRTGPDRCPIPILAYAGESDNIVTPASAKGVFPDTGVLPGDHFSIIQPDSPEHRAYKALKSNILGAADRASRAPLQEERSERLEGTTNPNGPGRAHAPSIFSAAAGVTEGAVEAGRPTPSGENAMSHVIVRWNPRHRTVDFILSPETALSWISEFRREGEGDGD